MQLGVHLCFSQALIWKAEVKHSQWQNKITKVEMYRVCWHQLWLGSVKMFIDIIVSFAHLKSKRRKLSFDYFLTTRHSFVSNQGLCDSRYSHMTLCVVFAIAISKINCTLYRRIYSSLLVVMQNIPVNLHGIYWDTLFFFDAVPSDFETVFYEAPGISLNPDCRYRKIYLSVLFFSWNLWALW